MTFAEKVQRLNETGRKSILTVEEEAVYKMPNDDLEVVDSKLLVSTANSIVAAGNANREPLRKVQTGLRNLRISEKYDPDADDIW